MRELEARAFRGRSAAGSSKNVASLWGVGRVFGKEFPGIRASMRLDFVGMVPSILPGCPCV